jgi:hypothetical protein
LVCVCVFSFISGGFSRNSVGIALIKNVLFFTVAFFCNLALRAFSSWPVIIGMTCTFTLYLHVAKISRSLCFSLFSDFFPHYILIRWFGNMKSKKSSFAKMLVHLNGNGSARDVLLSIYVEYDH